ncbi:hypothetical protein BOX15_Mlig001598g10 [Macrostomum lignano]|uniref:Caspase family p20 domain-containing protein n=1 Tax=Macrostomum lignano TaxID=282301 RepID=A0A267F6E0_9PLAT|nr:hypothetical protein BOX15_Mlig001598g10 [Macrostomum lignano]
MQLQRCSDQLERHGCFVCFLMAHGSPDCVFGSDGRPCRIPDVTKIFQSSCCRSLAGKPKIFFIQACRGQHHDAPLDDSSSKSNEPQVPEPVPAFSPLPRPTSCCATPPQRTSTPTGFLRPAPSSCKPCAG